jgi:hypothetical protein
MTTADGFREVRCPVFPVHRMWMGFRRSFLYACSFLCLASTGCSSRQAPPNADPAAPIESVITDEVLSSLGSLPEETVPGSSRTLLLSPLIPEADRLMPTGVELEHTFLGPDDETWVTERITVTLLTRQCGDAMRLMGVDGPFQAPAPLTRDQTLVLIPGATEVEAQGARWVLATLGDGEYSLSYFFDEQGRTAEVDWDPTADSGSYRFYYSYENCSESSEDCRPLWIDDLTPEQKAELQVL